MKISSDKGFTLIEMLLVLGILSVLSVMMIYTANGARQISTAHQGLAVTQQNARLVNNLLERDLRIAGAGLYDEIYRTKNGNIANELVDSNPDSFDYELVIDDLKGIMIPPIEVTNDTDDEQQSYMNPLVETADLTSMYREYGTDMITIYSSVMAGLDAGIDEYTGQGQESVSVTDPAIGARFKNFFDKLGGKPQLVLVIDDEGKYATLRTITNARETGGIYKIDMNPSNSVNQPTNFDGFFDNLYQGVYTKQEMNDPNFTTSRVQGDNMTQIQVLTYFVYSHPDISKDARGWLVRLDMATVVSNGMTIDATDPDTIRPFVVAENVSDFQVALAVDSNEDGIIAASEWHNSEDMEDYSHLSAGTGTVTAEFIDLINNLSAVRFSVVTYTDEMTEDDPYGFAEKHSSEYYMQTSDVNDVADRIGITPNLEDRNWDGYSLADRLWYRRAIQQTRVAKIRNLDLENTFARTK